MNGLFQNRRDFNASIGSWNVAQVGTMKMFQYATSFDQLSSWNVKVQNMLYMFVASSSRFASDVGCFLGYDCYGMFIHLLSINTVAVICENIKEKQYNTHNDVTFRSLAHLVWKRVSPHVTIVEFSTDCSAEAKSLLGECVNFRITPLL